MSEKTDLPSEKTDLPPALGQAIPGPTPEHKASPTDGDPAFLSRGVGWIYCCQPTYGSGHPSSHRQFWRGGGNRTRPHVFLEDGGGSLLANSFNRHWINALNCQDEGYAITHFLMVHDDVVPHDGFRDQLLSDLLEAQEKDPAVAMMAAVIPIKDPQGLTSTGIDAENEQYCTCPKVLRRLTLSESLELPEVFSAEDCGYDDGQLLGNTGCFIVDLTRPWRTEVIDDDEVDDAIRRVRSCWIMNNTTSAEDRQALKMVLKDLSARRKAEKGDLKVFFTIKDRIRRCTVPADLSNGEPSESRWIAEVSPEDWNFCRALKSVGAKVRATRRVKLSHMGMIPFNNNESWGAVDQDEVLRCRHGGKKIGRNGEPTPIRTSER